MVMARMTLPTEPRVSAISAMASRIEGIDMMPSITRMMASALRMKPATRPMARPSTEARMATEKTTSSRAGAVEHAGIDVAAEHVGAEPELRRGLAVLMRVEIAVGSTVPRKGAKMATRMIVMRIDEPMTMVG